jgi:sulfate transporter 4
MLKKPSCSQVCTRCEDTQKSWIAVQVKENLLLDVGIGLSLTFMVVPQGMSYALLAGLPVVYGLYGACVPVLVYTLLGTSRHLAVGPTAVSSLLTGSVLRRVYPMAKQIADPNNPGALLDGVQKQYNKAAIQVWNSAHS